MVSKFGSPNEIWRLMPEKEDLIAGAEYALVTLPWTFNRMMLNTKSSGLCQRALNIAKGIVGQEMLRRALQSRGVAVELQRKSYRDDDLFDFRFKIDDEITKLDVKTINHYSNYSDVGRSPLTPQLIADNSGYDGPDWRNFFPMLVPHTQIAQEKDAYCFAICSSIDFRREPFVDRCGYMLASFPYGEHLPFLSSSKLCLIRENQGKWFYLSVGYDSTDLLNGSGLKIKLIGEFAGQGVGYELEINRGDRSHRAGPFSCFTSIVMEESSFGNFVGQLSLQVVDNELRDKVFNSAKKDINKLPTGKLTFAKPDFVNLVLPSSYVMYVIGWIPKSEFLLACKKYQPYVWPVDSVNKFHNQIWLRLSPDDLHTFTQCGFGDCISPDGKLFKAGWLKTTGRGGGACCYVFPNIGHNGGVKETNLYVLPQDLYTMGSLKV